jgi:hypothetical protein
MSRFVVRLCTLVFAASTIAATLAAQPGDGAACSTPEDGPPRPLGAETQLASLSPKTSITPPSVKGGGCPEDMVEVEGEYCPWVEQKCLRWLDPETKMRCGEFAPTQCATRTVKKHFCIDRYEYPNKPGAKPEIFVTFNQAAATCSAEGKRLCVDSEWTLACEGNERLPYPYGYARNAEACNIDKPYINPDERAIANPQTRQAELARLDQRELSGSRESCVSPYGVHDMTGNVDEWVVNESGHPYRSALKGGYWGPVRTRCRPATTAHDENFAFYQIGFRCCADIAGTSAKPAVASGRATGLAGS